MRPFYKILLLFGLMILSTTTVKAQTLIVDKANENYSENFDVPITIDSITFNSFKIKLSTLDPSLVINQVILNKKFSKGTLKFSSDGSIYTIDYTSESPIAIVKKEKIFDLKMGASDRFLDKNLITITQSDFYNTEKVLSVTEKVKPSTVNQFVLFKNDAIVFGLLMLALGFVFYTESIKQGFWPKFYKYIPGLLMCYMIPAIFNSLGLISAEVSETYYIASRYLLPASLVLLTISIDLKAVFNLGWKALVMFFTGTIGIIIGGPIAILIISTFSPETVGGAGFDAVWRGLATLAGSWIGGGANQAAMLEIYGFNQELYGGMVLVDIVVANIWLAVLLLGIGKREKIDNWLKADNTAINELQQKVQNFSEKTIRIPSLSDLLIILMFAFAAVGIAHFGADVISTYLSDNFEAVSNPRSALSSFGSQFFWLISIATLIGILLSFTKAKNYEGAGASKIGSVFIYILVATIGMKMDLGKIFENPGLILIGLVWMAIHAGLLILIAKLIKAPYFFLAVGSQANVGGAASAPVVAAAFHPSLATVGALLAVFGYVVGTYGALLCAELMRIVAVG
ncbi:putative membrane protein [Gelidibacter algens]|uniref:Putative membrane protein n=2 Tax=Gelidibacter algens TaxID=49280 RepID=A0A327RSE8_9FLAO|nr:putative membrane protein [Gelidibacter algens]